ncbi:hypothetical protein SAMN04488498_118100 [Mesorhizobium albiziae]|uniref:Uncharacterized protein n=1 Tax=Neomesorhizobium albiziae TaxID=335020 RepID=A0A1I4DPC4_9HYPH|nr:type I secretion protein [Mesorhizobium albiziae]GLS31257.1 type I secretion system ATPase [Mesorhizobium albiziae]SFK94789.1 hypothetical protein SAMN04488498_118100 [Mesorhizobium albiziae]
MYMDKVTQIISHFIGEFEAVTEQARLKKAYEEFAASRKAAELEQPLPDADVDVQAPYPLIDYQPDIPYMPKPPELHRINAPSDFVFNPPTLDLGGELSANIQDAVQNVLGGRIVNHSPSLSEIFEPPPPGSIGIVVKQTIRLDDNDYVSAGGHGLVFNPGPADQSMLGVMQEAAADLSPIDDLTLDSTDGDIGEFILTAAELLDGMIDVAGDDVTIIKADQIDGIYVNGQSVEEAPDLADYADFLKDEEETDGPLPELEVNAHFNAEGELEIDVSVELQAGGNTLVNSAVVTNSWATSTVLAVAGDSVELNAIVQINAVSDVDSLGQTLNGWVRDEQGAEGLFNIAMFKHIAPEAAQAAADAVEDFPKNWVVTKIEGDLTILNWIEQYSFVSDNDIAVLSSSGVTSKIGTGENTAVNDVSLEELGRHYDLIVVGGSLYDANLIQQLNVLLDNDLIGAVDGFETNGEASVAAGNNLLWNQAAIAEIDGGSGPLVMPSEYLAAAQGLAAGDDTALKGLLGDSAFAGLDSLRVLYISGDMLNLNYVKQTNILGDSDQVALAMNELFPHPEAEWTLTTGNNELVNFAAIVDVDATDKTYVGGGQYSDEVLIQANLIEDDRGLAAQDPDQLVNEAVAFLDDGLTDEAGDGDPLIQPMPAADHAPSEIMLG